jgi:hypothetical protein
MSKLIIIEGTDRVGKDTLVRGLVSQSRNYIVRHFSSPPGDDNETKTQNQKRIFRKEFVFQNQVRKDKSITFDFILWNRAHIGEYVYGPMYRQSTPESWVPSLEKEFLFGKDTEIYLIYLWGDADFICKNDDGESFTSDPEKKRQEQIAFENAIENSIISKKLKIKVNDGNNYNDQQRILATVRDFVGL